MSDAMGSFTTDALIKRWKDAFVWANGMEPPNPPTYERGWFVWRNSAFVTSRSRRKEMIDMIMRLENRARQVPA